MSNELVVTPPAAHPALNDVLTTLGRDIDVAIGKVMPSDAVAAARDLKVADHITLETAVGVLSRLAGARKALDEMRKIVAEPFNEIVRRINNRFNTPLETVRGLEGQLKEEIRAFQAELEKRASEERERLEREYREAELKRRQAEEARAAEAKAAEPEKPELDLGGFVLMPPPEPAAAVPSRIRTSEGAVHTARVWKWRVVDEAAIPREYLMINDKAINAAVRAGARSIAGVEVYQETQIKTR